MGGLANAGAAVAEPAAGATATPAVETNTPAAPAATDAPGAEPAAGESTEQTTQETDAPLDILGGESETDSSEPAAPEPYEPFTLPDGMELDTALLERATPALRAKEFSQEEAQELVTILAEQRQADAVAAAQTLTEQRKQQVESLRNDPDYGGAKFEETMADARLSRDRLGGEALKKAFEETGAGSHPEIVKAMARVAVFFKEDGIVFGETPAAAQESPEDRAYAGTTPAGPGG